MLGALAAGAALVACSSTTEQASAPVGSKAELGPSAATDATAPPIEASTKPALIQVEADPETWAANNELATVKLDVAPGSDFDPLDVSLTPPPDELEPSPDDVAPSMDDAPPSMDPAGGSAPPTTMEDSSNRAITVVVPTTAAAVDASTTTVSAPGSTTTPTPTTVSAPGSTTTPTPTTRRSTETTTGVQPRGNGQLTAALVVNKLTFGPKQGQIAQVEASGAQAFVEDQLGKTGPDPAVERVVQGIKPMHYSPRECRAVGLRSWWMTQYATHISQYRNAKSDHQLFEMMCHTWMDHFNVFVGSDRPAYFIPEYQEKTIRPNAMGTFKDLLKATAHSGAMLVYLDNRLNDASTPGGINENYGRELLELHTLGIDRNERKVYSEADVRTVSTVMGGWSIETDDKVDSYARFLYRPELAYSGPDVSILGGAWSTAGLSGKARGDSLLEFLATHPSTAGNVALRLCTRFVSDNPSQGLVDSTAKVFLDNDTAIVPTLRHIFNSDEFAKSGGLKVRRPMEYEAALMRFVGTNIEVDDYEGNDARSLRWYLKTGRLHEPWRWQQPDGFPDQADYWIKTDGFYRRWHDANYAARGARWGNNLDTIAPALAGRNATGAVQELATQLGVGPLPEADVATMVATVGLDPASPEVTLNVRNHLQPLTALVMSHPRFQTR